MAERSPSIHEDPQYRPPPHTQEQESCHIRGKYTVETIRNTPLPFLTKWTPHPAPGLGTWKETIPQDGVRAGGLLLGLTVVLRSPHKQTSGTLWASGRTQTGGFCRGGMMEEEVGLSYSDAQGTEGSQQDGWEVNLGGSHCFEGPTASHRKRLETGIDSEKNERWKCYGEMRGEDCEE